MVFLQDKTVSLFEVCELFPSVSLDDCSSTKKKFSHDEKKSIAKDSLKAVSHVHKAGIIHRDIKEGNILVSINQQKRRAKLIDFNIACFQTEAREKTYPNFSYETAPPECAKFLLENAALLKNLHFPVLENLAPLITPKIDIWGLGCAFYALFFEEGLPWRVEGPMNDENIILRLKKISELKENWIAPAHHGHPFYPLIKAMLTVDAEKRPSIKDVMKLFEKLSK
jgi:serine/threonine protein kinase